jgi:FAD/FMN-containing dehydrogenase
MDENPALTGLPRLDGSLTASPEVTSGFARDFGGIRSRRPLAVLRPGSAADLARMIRFARARNLSVTPRGQGRSAYGQSQAAGIIADMSALSAAPRLAGREITVPAGMTWRQVLSHTLPLGLRPRAPSPVRWQVALRLLTQPESGATSSRHPGADSNRHGGAIRKRPSHSG